MAESQLRSPLRPQASPKYASTPPQIPKIHTRVPKFQKYISALQILRNTFQHSNNALRIPVRPKHPNYIYALQKCKKYISVPPKCKFASPGRRTTALRRNTPETKFCAPNSKEPFSVPQNTRTNFMHPKVSETYRCIPKPLEYSSALPKALKTICNPQNFRILPTRTETPELPSAFPHSV